MSTRAPSLSSSSNTTTKNFNAALDISGASTISYASSAFTHTLNLNRAVTGTGTLTLNWTGSASARSINFASGQTNNLTGALIFNSTPGAITANLNSAIGTPDVTINNALWTVNLAASANTFKSLSGSVGGTLQAAGVATVLTTGSGNTNTSFSGKLANGTGTLALTKTGSGTQTLSGANTYTGATVISGGTLAVTGSISSSASVAVQNGGTLLFGGTSDRIGDAVPLTLGAAAAGTGGTLNTGGLSENIGPLTLSASSNIDFGSGASVLLFGAGTTFASGSVLTVDNWSGNAGTGSGTDQLLFSQDMTAQLGRITFTGYGPGSAQVDRGGGQFEIVPIPEPATWSIAFPLLGLLALRQRFRRGTGLAR